LRFSLGNEYLAIDKHEDAIRHLQRAVQLDSSYSAAWKLLGRALALAGRETDAVAAYGNGIEIAEQKGDRQAAKEMTVFLKRLLKHASQDD
jgi:predicted Zn-dependent protease